MDRMAMRELETLTGRAGITPHHPGGEAATFESHGRSPWWKRTRKSGRPEGASPDFVLPPRAAVVFRPPVSFKSRRFAAWVCITLLAGGLAACHRAADDLPARAWLEKGWGHFRLEEFDEAQRAFETALEKEAGPDASLRAADETLRLNALYGLGLVASVGHHGEQAIIAQKRFEEVVAGDHSDKKEMAAWATLAMVRDQALPVTADAAVDEDAVTAGYTRVMEDYPATPAAGEAFLYRTALRVQRFKEQDARQAITEIDAYLQAHQDTHLKSALLALESTACQTLKDYKGALRTAIASLDSKEQDPANPAQNNILEYYRIAMMAQFDVGDFATARAYYNRFLKEYPRDQRAYTVRLLLKHLDETEAALRDGKAVPELSELVRAGVEQ
jgi:tetratricopeptide (TPR) repeat protein